MSTGIRPRTQRKAFRSTSSDSDTTGKDKSGDFASTEYSDFSNMATQSFEQSMESLKHDIMQDIHRDIYQPIITKLQNLTTEIQKLNDVTSRKCKYLLTPNDLEESATIVAARNGETNVTEPKRLFQGDAEASSIYEDPCKLRPTIGRTHSVDNQTYGCANRDSDVITSCRPDDGVKDRRKESVYENVNVTKPKEFWSSSLNTKPKSVAVKPRPRTAIPVNRASFDERECLANALQFHIEDLIDGTVFQDSELPDCLLAEDCLTEDECASIRKLLNRKDQIRVLVSRIKERDLRVLNGFMKHIHEHNPAVADKINQKFETNKRNGMKGKLCALCKLMKQFNVKDVVDGMWAIQAINDELFHKIIHHSQASVGTQGDLWKEVINSLNSLEKKNAEEAHRKLLKALTVKNLFTHLAEGINIMLIKNHGILTCACKPRLILPKRTSFLGTIMSGESFLPESSSDSASNDMTSIDGTENGDLPDRIGTDDVDGMSSITEGTEGPTSPTNTAPVEEMEESRCLQSNESFSGVVHVDTSASYLKSKEEYIYDNNSGCVASAKKSVIQKKPIPAPKPKRVVKTLYTAETA